MKPEVEYFFGVPYKCYCGKCGRILTTGAVAIGQMKNWMERACPWCGVAIDTVDEAGNDQEEKHGVLAG